MGTSPEHDARWVVEALRLNQRYLIEVVEAFARLASA